MCVGARGSRATGILAMVGTKVGFAALLGLLGAASWVPAFAAPNLVTNGDFELETNPGTAQNQSYQLVSGTDPNGATSTGWSNAGYTFVFVPGAGTSGTTADTTGAISRGERQCCFEAVGPWQRPEQRPDEQPEWRQVPRFGRRL